MTPKFFDAHTHLNMGFEQDWHEVGRKTLEVGVSFVNVGSDEVNSKLTLEQVKELGEGAWCTVGIHPTEGKVGDFAEISKLATDPKVVAIGECGLEYFKLSGDIQKEKERQKELFIKHIELALEVGKPLMVHCRASEKSMDAYDDCYEILKKYKNEVGDRLQFNMHFFTNTWEVAKKFLDLGAYLSFPGVITFSSACDETIKNVPLDRIMSETDAPFATPAPYRGQRNEPAYVQFVVEKITELRTEPKEDVLIALVANAQKFFNL